MGWGRGVCGGGTDDGLLRRWEGGREGGGGKIYSFDFIKT